MNFKPVFFVNGILLLILAAVMLLPMMLDLADGNGDWRVFAVSEISTAFVGFLMIFASREREFRLTARETLLAAALGWIVTAGFGALPFCFSDLRLSVSQGFFESLSGLSTTGITVIDGLETQPRGILLWRSILHWLGGFSALMLGLAVFPLLQISGMQIFRTQSFDIAKITPSANQTAAYTCLIYASLTLACAFLLKSQGLSVFDALCHAMSAVSTGGFSTSDSSIAQFKSTGVEMTLMGFMLLGALPFTIYLRAARGDARMIFKDGQVRSFLGGCAGLVLILTLVLLVSSPLGITEAVRHAAFKAVTLMTTSGFTLQDGAIWGPFTIALGFCAAFVGGCSGSTAGGILIFRCRILLSTLKMQIRQLIVQNGVFQVYHDRKPIDSETQNALMAFVLSFAACCLIAGVGLMMTGLEFKTAFALAFAAITNVGTSLTSMAGVSTSMQSLDPSALWILSTCMLLGRMEIFGALVFFAPRFWKA